MIPDNKNRAYELSSTGHGFHITFENGYVLSVQFGPHNYCGVRTAECAVWHEDVEMDGRQWATRKFFKTREDVAAGVSPEDLAKAMNKIARKKVGDE